MKGLKVAILGLGRSGLAIGRAALAMGAEPIVFDEKSEADLPKRDILEEARSIGLTVIPGYRPEGQWFHLQVAGDPWVPDLIVANPAVPKWHPALASGQVISEVEFAYRISKAPIVAITGTNGKSTTTVMTYLCLQACGVDAVLCGNIFGSGYPEVPLTEAALTAHEDQILVAEISSFQLEWINSFRPIAAAITNITPDHLDRYDNFEQYRDTKRRIHRFQQASDYGVAVSESPVQGSPTILAVGKDALIGPKGLEMHGQLLPLRELHFFEPHNLANAATASLLTQAALQATGRAVQQESIFDGLRNFRGLAHRMESVGERDGVSIVNNSMCTNPAAVVSSARGLVGRAHILLGGTNKNLEFEPLKLYLDESEHLAYIFGSDAEELSKMLGNSFKTYRTMEEAFKAATDQAKPGDTIMLAPGCASTDQFRDFRHRGDVFKAIAMEWLNR